MADAQERADQEVRLWKMKRVRVETSAEFNSITLSPTLTHRLSPVSLVQLIKMLDEAKGNGTSMISLILPPKSQISQTQTMLQTEYGTASNIKSRVNRQSVLGAITSAQQRLKLYTKVPPNGLIVYTGTVVTDEGKEKKMNIDFEPFKPINTSLYLCDNKFHTEALSELMETDQRYGFIVMDGHGSLYGTLSGNHREVLHKFSVDLPKKHGRGGQSALRFARLRMEKRHNYVRKVAEIAVQHFITNDRPNVAGLVLAGSADFKTELSQSDMFDLRLQQVIMAIVDVSYGTWLGRRPASWVPYQFPVRCAHSSIARDRRSNGGYPTFNPNLLQARLRTLAPATGTPSRRHPEQTHTSCARTDAHAPILFSTHLLHQAVRMDSTRRSR